LTPNLLPKAAATMGKALFNVLFLMVYSKKMGKP
jgi:hypothetical protein